MRLRLVPLFALFAAALRLTMAEAALPPDLVREILTREQARTTADGYLAGLTADDRGEVRARAYRALGRLQDPALVEVLTRGLKDPDETVRIEAAFALGQLNDTVAEAPLGAALTREKAPAVRERIVEALGKSGGDASVEFLAGMLSSSEAPLARQAALALGVMAVREIDISTTTAALDQALRSADPELRWRAAFAVQRGKLANTTIGLTRALKSEDTMTLIYAARAVGALRSKSLSEKALPLLKHEDWRVRVEALRCLGAAKNYLASSQASLLLDDPNDNVRLTAIETMGKLASGGGLGRIVGYDASSDWRVRAAYVKAQAEGSGDGAIPDLRLAMKDPDWRIRRAAAEAFSLVKSEQSLLLIESMVNDESPLVLAAVANSLVEFPQVEAVRVLRGMLRGSDAAVLTSAANAAGQRLDREAVPLLLTAYDRLQSPVDTEPMAAILEALGAILPAGDDEGAVGTLGDVDRAKAEALLEAARHDADYAVSRSAADALSKIRGELVEPATAAPAGVPAELDLDLAVALETGAKNVTARLTTERGVIVLRLFGSEAPGTVANFVTLAGKGYFNGLTFHRVVPDFVIQGGDPHGDGWGGPGYAIRCEVNPLLYDTGRLGMALSGKDTGGSQFFITHSPQPHLNGRYTIFGEVMEGRDVVDKIQVGDVIDEVRIEGL